MRNDVHVRRAVDRYQMGLPNAPTAGRSGELLGRGAGSSLEFQEFREYLPGDDIRHLDWAAYARSDALMIRLYREEISPRTEIFLDCSKSMSTGTTGVKALVAKQLAAMFALMSAQLGGRPALIMLDDQLSQQPWGVDDLERLGAVELSSTVDMAELAQAGRFRLRPQSVRVLISDFLFPHDPSKVIRHFAGGASILWVIQLLNNFEQNPQPLGGRRLTDIETGIYSDLMINSGLIDRYRQRLGRLQNQLRQEVRRQRGTFVTSIANRGLEQICRSNLCASGILRAR